jgi:hypothetical protein
MTDTAAPTDPFVASAIDADIAALEAAFAAPSPVAVTVAAPMRFTGRAVHVPDVTAPWSLGARLVVSLFVMLPVAVACMVALEAFGPSR